MLTMISHQRAPLAHHNQHYVQIETIKYGSSWFVRSFVPFTMIRQSKKFELATRFDWAAKRICCPFFLFEAHIRLVHRSRQKRTSNGIHQQWSTIDDEIGRGRSAPFTVGKITRPIVGTEKSAPFIIHSFIHSFAHSLMKTFKQTVFGK
jgi:hypothetical protein